MATEINGAKPPPEKAEMLAMMLATGRFSLAQLAKFLDLTPAYIQTMRKSPLFANQVKKWQDKIYASIVDAAISDLLADSQENIAFLRSVRNGEIEDDEPAVMRARLRAAEVLLDRQVPKASNALEDTGGVHITINTEARERFKKAAIEVESVEALPSPPADAASQRASCAAAGAAAGGPSAGGPGAAGDERSKSGERSECESDE